MLFIYLYRGDLYSDLWKSDLYFSPAGTKVHIIYCTRATTITMVHLLSFVFVFLLSWRYVITLGCSVRSSWFGITTWSWTRSSSSTFRVTAVHICKKAIQHRHSKYANDSLRSKRLWSNLCAEVGALFAFHLSLVEGRTNAGYMRAAHA